MTVVASIATLTPVELWEGLGWPLMRLLFYVSIGLAIGNLIESLNWTRGMAKLAAPLVHWGRQKDIAGASFSMAFFSSIAANSMLAESYEKGELSKRELVLANLFNSLPTFFVHMPTVFFITTSFIGSWAAVYVGLNLVGAIVRTAAVVLIGHFLLPPLPEGCVVCRLDERRAATWREALGRTWQRFTSRIGRIVKITVPIYILVWWMTRMGYFRLGQEWVSTHVEALAWLSPEVVSIVVMQGATQFAVAMSTAGVLLNTGELTGKAVVLALLAGNVLSGPLRAVRHQFPYYAGIFTPRIALNLIVASQSLRMASVAFMGILYYYLG